MSRLDRRERLVRWTTWFLFAFTAAVMILGATLDPSSRAWAQEEPTEAAATNNATNGATAGATNAGAPPAATNGATNNATNDDATADAPPATTGGEEAGGAKEEGGEEKTTTSLTKKRAVGQGEASGFADRAISFFGIFVIIGLAVLMSNNRKAINWQLVGVGIGMQITFALIIFFMPGGDTAFAFATDVVKKLLEFSNDGAAFIFSSYVTSKWEPGLINFTFAVLPTIIFFSSLMTILYHLGVMQRIVYVFAKVMQKAMGTSGAESLSAAANIFVGQTEAPLVIKPYVQKMTKSELMTVMTGGFATVAGGVLALYVGMLESTFPDIAGHLLAASIMSAPAALVIGKIIVPETETPETSGHLEMNVESEDVNVIDAAARGASEGLKLALNVAAMLLAFLALMALINYVMTLPSLVYNKSVLRELIEAYVTGKHAIPAGCVNPGFDPTSGLSGLANVDALKGVADDKVLGCVQAMGATAGQPGVFTMPMITAQLILGYLFWPLAWAMGVPASDCLYIGQLLGEKIILNELVAYSTLQKFLVDPSIQLADRSVIIATYALCGFANVGSIGIQLGGIGGIAPERKGDLARIAFKAMLAGTLAACMTGTIAGILV
jgi:CNT family concentrative nucleoside transporter